MKKITGTIATLISIVTFAHPTLALTINEADAVGQALAEKTCEAIWSHEGTPTTDEIITEALQNMPGDQQRQFFMLIQISEKYGDDHPLYEAYIQGMGATLLSSCWNEFEKLPSRMRPPTSSK